MTDFYDDEQEQEEIRPGALEAWIERAPKTVKSDSERVPFLRAILNENQSRFEQRRPVVLEIRDESEVFTSVWGIAVIDRIEFVDRSRFVPVEVSGYEVTVLSLISMRVVQSQVFSDRLERPLSDAREFAEQWIEHIIPARKF